MTENPYRPSGKSKSEETSDLGKRSVRLGRFFCITLLAAGAGLVIAQAITIRSALVVWGAPLLCIFVACSICTYLLRGPTISKAKQLGIVLLTTLASYLLFVPICVAGAIAAVGMGARRDMYSPNLLGLNLASIFAAALALNVTFFFALRILNRLHSGGSRDR